VMGCCIASPPTDTGIRRGHSNRDGRAFSTPKIRASEL
jgi:hypothetical protein